jgi:hypothetical protein
VIRALKSSRILLLDLGLECGLHRTADREESERSPVIIHHHYSVDPASV